MWPALKPHPSRLAPLGAVHSMSQSKQTLAAAFARGRGPMNSQGLAQICSHTHLCPGQNTKVPQGLLPKKLLADPSSSSLSSPRQCGTAKIHPLPQEELLGNSSWSARAGGALWALFLGLLAAACAKSCSTSNISSTSAARGPQSGLQKEKKETKPNKPPNIIKKRQNQAFFAWFQQTLTIKH